MQNLAQFQAFNEQLRLTGKDPRLTNVRLPPVPVSPPDPPIRHKFHIYSHWARKNPNVWIKQQMVAQPQAISKARLKPFLRNQSPKYIFDWLIANKKIPAWYQVDPWLGMMKVMAIKETRRKRNQKLRETTAAQDVKGEVDEVLAHRSVKWNDKNIPFGQRHKVVGPLRETPITFARRFVTEATSAPESDAGPTAPKASKKQKKKKAKVKSQPETDGKATADGKTGTKGKDAVQGESGTEGKTTTKGRTTKRATKAGKTTDPREQMLNMRLSTLQTSTSITRPDPNTGTPPPKPAQSQKTNKGATPPKPARLQKTNEGATPKPARPQKTEDRRASSNTATKGRRTRQRPNTEQGSRSESSSKGRQKSKYPPKPVVDTKLASPGPVEMSAEFYPVQRFEGVACSSRVLWRLFWFVSVPASPSNIRQTLRMIHSQSHWARIRFWNRSACLHPQSSRAARSPSAA
jgi:hypothetical protein